MDIIQKYHSDTPEYILEEKKRCKWWKGFVKYGKRRVGNKCDAQFYITILIDEINYKTILYKVYFKSILVKFSRDTEPIGDTDVDRDLYLSI